MLTIGRPLTTQAGHFSSICVAPRMCAPPGRIRPTVDRNRPVKIEDVLLQISHVNTEH